MLLIKGFYTSPTPQSSKDSDGSSLLVTIRNSRARLQSTYSRCRSVS